MRPEESDAVSSEILLAFWKIHILHHAEQEAVYGLWMIEELRRHGYRISPGTLYPLLRRMEGYGWLEAEHDRQGPRRERRCYRLTPRGESVLKFLRQQVAELHREVVEQATERPRKRRAKASP